MALLNKLRDGLATTNAERGVDGCVCFFDGQVRAGQLNRSKNLRDEHVRSFRVAVDARAHQRRDPVHVDVPNVPGPANVSAADTVRPRSVAGALQFTRDGLRSVLRRSFSEAFAELPAGLALHHEPRVRRELTAEWAMRTRRREAACVADAHFSALSIRASV